mgnify:CR=1 FL=1
MEKDKKLVGGQKKLDVDGDGTITGDDFKALRERTQKQMGGMMEGQPLPTEDEQMQSLMGDKSYSEEMQEELEPLPEKPEGDMEMEPDEEMEDTYLDFIIDEALDEDKFNNHLVIAGWNSTVPSILKLIDNLNHNILEVYTQPPNKKNRGQKIQNSPIHDFSNKLNLPVRYPIAFDEEEINHIKKLKPDYLRNQILLNCQIHHLLQSNHNFYYLTFPLHFFLAY